MPRVSDLCQFLDAFAPPRLAEEWDNVGLLVGDQNKEVQRVMTCLTITPQSCAEAVRKKADLIVTHHPLPFKPLRRLTADTTPGRLLLELVRAGIAVHSPHTAFDSAAEGINQQLGQGIGLVEIAPLVAAPGEAGESLGSGRLGRFTPPQKLAQIAGRLKAFLNITGLQVVGESDPLISTAAVACGSGGSFLEPAIGAGCQLLVTGEASFHTCLEAQASGIALLLTGHFASERFAVVRLAAVLAGAFPALSVWASEEERDPLLWI